MSTDPKKTVKTIIFAYFLASMFLIAGMQMTFSYIPVAIFTGIAVILYLTSCLSLYKQYQKYHIPIYLFLIGIGIALSVFGVVIAIASQI